MFNVGFLSSGVTRACLKAVGITNPITVLTSLNFSFEFCDTQSPFTDPIGMNEMYREMNPTCRNESVTSLIKRLCFHGKL